MFNAYQLYTGHRIQACIQEQVEEDIQTILLDLILHLEFNIDQFQVTKETILGPADLFILIFK